MTEDLWVCWICISTHDDRVELLPICNFAPRACAICGHTARPPREMCQVTGETADAVRASVAAFNVAEGAL